MHSLNVPQKSVKKVAVYYDYRLYSVRRYLVSIAAQSRFAGKVVRLVTTDQNQTTFNVGKRTAVALEEHLLSAEKYNCDPEVIEVQHLLECGPLFTTRHS